MKLLETTLRDGSYAINFQFSARDTSTLCKALEQAGIELIEIGHGVGLRASQSGHGTALETDEAYLKAAADVCKKAQFGMFCIPGIARVEDVDMSADLGAKFIRIGSNVTEVRDSEPFIARARKRGLFVCANFMKSYASEPAEFAELAELSWKYGSQVVYIVDSAGGMLPHDVERYVDAIRRRCDAPIGFHGHNNLGLGVANTLRAVELGAAIIDTSLQGLGRSAGNASTEMTVLALQRMNVDLKIDALAVLDAGEKYIRPLMRRSGVPSLDVVSGYAQFHSSYMSVIHKYSSKYGVDPRKLIINLCAVDRVNAPPELVERLAKELTTAEDFFPARFEFDGYHGSEQSKS